MRDRKQNSTFIWFMGLMGNRLPIYLLAVFVSTVGLAGSKVANAWLIKSIMTAAQTKQMDGLFALVAINCILIAVSMFTWRFGIVRYNIEAKKGIARVEKRVFAKALRLPYSYYENNHSADFMSKLVYDMEKAGDIYGSRFRRLADSIITTIIYLIPMLFLNWQLTMCLMLVSACAFLINGIFATPMKNAGSKLSTENKIVTEKITSILAGMEVTKIFNVGRRLLEEYNGANKKCLGIQKRANVLTAILESSNSFFDLLSSLAFLGVGVWFMSMNLTNLGELAAIYAIYGSFRRVVLEIGKYIPQMMNCIANAQRIRDFLDMPEEPENIYLGRKCEAAGLNDNEIVVNDISFSYNDDRQILNKFSVDCKRDEFVAITGHSGCGKSTFAKLLLGFYEASEGSMAIKGKSYSEISLWSIRENIGYVPQEPYLFQVSIAENIAYGKTGTNRDSVSMEEVIEAAKAANAHDFIMKLPNGYDTILGERGNTLSGGEKQRIAIARAILKNAPILLLDEATSALDNESERLVNEAIQRLCDNRTTIMIAHRASTIARADRQVCMD